MIHDLDAGSDTYTEKLGYRVQADLFFKEVHSEEYVAVVIPGGRAPEYIRSDPDFLRII